MPARAILTYHSVDDSGSVISVSPGRFAEDVAWLASGAVEVLSVAELIAYRGARHAVAITFDDAFDNFAIHAWPRLREHELPATMFVPTAFVGQRNSWDTMPGGAMPNLALMTWETIAKLAEDGLTIGAHTRTHPDLRPLDDASLQTEIRGALDDIARKTGRRPEGFAYPYGYHDRRVVAAVRANCAWACTTRLGVLKEHQDVHCLPRLDAYFLRGPGRLGRFPAVSFRAYMSLRAGIRRIRGR